VHPHSLNALKDVAMNDAVAHVEGATTSNRELKSSIVLALKARSGLNYN
jgi:hypothetical protein